MANIIVANVILGISSLINVITMQFKDKRKILIGMILANFVALLSFLILKKYSAINDLIRNSKKNISICQNCGRYFLPNSGKEIYCELFNLDGSPSCRSYASRKTYERKIIDNVAELTYKREYQRRITRVYRSDETEKTMRQKEFALWKTKARKQLSLYRQGKITQQDFCEWIEKNK